MGKLNYRIPNTNDFREIYVKVTDTLPVGAVCQYGGSTAPSGYLMCNGQAVSRTTYADLFKAIGTSFGSGDGVTTFNVPNFNGRVPVGLDGIDADFNTIGKTGGSKYIQDHKHTYGGTNGGVFAGTVNNTWNNLGSGAGGVTANDTSTNTGGVLTGTGGVSVGNAGNLQPYIVTNFIIKASKKVALDKGNVVDSLDGSDTDSAPSVRAVKEALVETYSTDEVKTNKVWIDGKPIYRKTFVKENATTGNNEISLSDLDYDYIVIKESSFIRSDFTFSPNRYKASLADDVVEAFINNNSKNLIVNVGSFWNNINCYVTLEYTKTTD